MTLYYCNNCGQDYSEFPQYILHINTLNPDNPDDTLFENIFNSPLVGRDWKKFFIELSSDSASKPFAIWLCCTECLIGFLTHHRITQNICPVCKERLAWEHIPYIENVTFDNHDSMLCCFKCFRSIWAGEN